MTEDAGPIAVILDGYVDEPACLGVPPYISPYIRTVAGVLAERGYSLRYFTIDQLRNDPQLFSAANRAGVFVMIAGVTVPGKYLGGTPATLTAIRSYHAWPGPRFAFTGGLKLEGHVAPLRTGRPSARARTPFL